MFADYCEIGPVDACDGTAKPRTYAWNKLVNLILVDNPVGTGFSFTKHAAGYARNEDQIAAQLITVFKSIFAKYPQLQQNSFYIFAESYGGKMAANAGVALMNAISQGTIKCNFKGVGLGDSWISPYDSVASYGAFLESVGHLNPTERVASDKYAKEIAAALEGKHFALATELWGAQQGYISRHAANVNWYNFLQHTDMSMTNLTKYINTVVKQQYKLDRTWTMSSGEVFEKLTEDFMQPAIDKVDTLLQFGYEVIVYNGQLDLIVDTLGTNAWIQKLRWSGLSGFNTTEKTVLRGSATGGVSAVSLDALASQRTQRLYYPGPAVMQSAEAQDNDIIGHTNYAFLQKYKNLSL